MISAMENIHLYQFYNSSDGNSENNLASTAINLNMSEMTYTLNQSTPISYELTFVSYTESNQVSYLLLSFDAWNSNASKFLQVSPSNITAPVYQDTTIAEAATTMGSIAQPVLIATSGISLLLYIQSKGASAHLMTILHVMARIIFMKLVDVNYLTPLATFYDYTDQQQFGLPNVIGKILGTDNSSSSGRRILASTLSSTSASDTQQSLNSLIHTNSTGNAIFNSYFSYSFSNVFLDGYGGIVFSSLVTLFLYLLIKAIAACIKNSESKIKKILTSIADSCQKSLLMTFLVSRYMYLCSSLILNYAFISLNGAYQVVSFVFAIIFTILLVLVLIITLCLAFYHGTLKRKLKRIRPLFDLISVMCQEYRSKTFLGRFLTFWVLISNLCNVLILLLLTRWVIVQLSLLMTLNLITIVFSLPKRTYKLTSTKIAVILTEVGFLSFAAIFLAMYFRESSGSSSSYRQRMILSWVGVGINISIISVQIISRIVAFIIAWRKARKAKKQLEKAKKQLERIQRFEISSDLRRINRIDLNL